MEERYKVVVEAEINQLKKNMNKVKDMFSQLKDKYTYEINPKLNVAQLNAELIKAQQELRKFKGIEITNKEQVKQIASLSTAIDTLKNRIIELGGTPFKLKDKVEETGEELQQVEQEVENINNAGKGTGLSNMFKDGLKSLKRFALSLFGLQSIWRVISRASSAYLQQNQELSSKIQAVWNGLGELLSPIINFLANLFLKLIGYINVLTKALFNFDFIAKANARTLKNQAKQANNATKALSGLDEITNINQDTGADASSQQPTGLIEVPELNEGLVKTLQDMAYWLKENWSWISKVGEVLLIAFGASTIAKILGGAGAGLIGLAGTLSTLATIGVVALGVDLFYKAITGRDLVQDLKDIYNGLNDVEKAKKNNEKVNKKLHEDYMVALKDKKEDAKQYQKNSKEVAQYTGMLKSNIEMSQHDMETHDKKSNTYKRAKEEIEANVQAYADLYKQGVLNEEQTKTYAKYMSDLGYNLDGTKKTIGDTANEIRDNLIKSVKDATEKTDKMTTATDKSKQALDKSKISTNQLQQELEKVSKSPFDIKINDSSINTTKTDTQSMVNFIVDKLKNPFKVNIEEGTKTKTIETDVNSMVTQITNALRNPFSLIFKSKVEKPSQSDIQSVVNSITSGVNNVLKLVGLKIPGFAIGTDLVKRDGLAYIHAGEQIVPADAVKGGYTGGNNDETNNLLRALIEVVQEKDFSATISSDDVGKASVNYIRNQNRIMGGSVI